MTPFSADAAQAITDIEQMAVDWLLGLVPVGALVVIAAVSLAVSWLSWAERARHAAHAGRIKT